jgi:hypothetical protein
MSGDDGHYVLINLMESLHGCTARVVLALIVTRKGLRGYVKPVP